MANRPKAPRTRNPLHNHPLMRKGGIHEKSNKAKRKAEKQKFKRELRQQWGYPIPLLTVLFDYPTVTKGQASLACEA